MNAIRLLSTLTCPQCGSAHEESMPTDRCRWFWRCPDCQTLLKPEPGDCCVYCSYGSVPCPPVQAQGKGACCGD